MAMGSVDELRKLPDANPPGTERVQVECGNAAETLKAVRNLAYVREATIFGRSLHLLKDATVSKEQFAKDLEAHGCKSPKVEPIEPTLEDVFVTLTNTTTARQVAEAK
jgi:hypothetical protein